LGKSLFKTTDVDILKETMREIEDKIINGQTVIKASAQYSFPLSNPTAKASTN
jgi:hypothetical protein